VDVYDHGVMPDGRPYIVMEFLAGEPLDARIDRVGVLTLEKTAQIVVQVSRALSRAHAAGIVHRDLKPENVFLVWDEEDQADIVKVVDFGIAKFTTPENAGISSSTKTGSLMGTPYYMSPEQARGLKNVDHRSDLWSLAVIAYEALTGQRPFSGEAVGDMLVHICTTETSPPSSLNPALPPAFDQWMRRALQKNPDHRFQDVRQMVEALLAITNVPGAGTFSSAASKPRESQHDSALQRGQDDHPQRAELHDRGHDTRGALTNAAIAAEVLPRKRASPRVWIAGFVLLVAVGVVLALANASDEPETAAEALVAAESSQDDQNPGASPSTNQPASPRSPGAAAEPPAAADSKEKAPDPEPTPKEAASAPSPRPVVQRAPRTWPQPSLRVRPSPEPETPPLPEPKPAPPASRRAPAPRAAPVPRAAPAPRAAPSPSALDLGY
jgi:serine/threonine-protein kinase